MNIKYDMFLLLALMGTASAGAQNKKAAKPKAKTTAVKPAMSAHAKALFDEMLPNTQKIFVIDSMVVSKDNILEAIPLPATYGRMEKTADFFNNPAKEGYAFVNGFGNKCYYTEMGTDSISRLYMQEKVGNEWGERIPVKEINERFTDISFPFMSSDGLTLYFSAKSEEEGLGKRDIYMTKYDAEEGKFLQAENIGLPFNSMDDDVTQCLERVFLGLYVISEAYDVVVSPAGLVGAEVLCTMVSEVVVHDEVGILRGTLAALSLFLHGSQTVDLLGSYLGRSPCVAYSYQRCEAFQTCVRHLVLLIVLALLRRHEGVNADLAFRLSA